MYAHTVLWPMAPYSCLANKPTYTHTSVCVHIDVYSHLSMHECMVDRQTKHGSNHLTHTPNSNSLSLSRSTCMYIHLYIHLQLHLYILVSYICMDICIYMHKYLRVCVYVCLYRTRSISKYVCGYIDRYV